MISGKERSFVNVVFCIHNTFKGIKPKLEIFSEVVLLIQAEDETSFYKTVQLDSKVTECLYVWILLLPRLHFNFHTYTMYP